jgi:hypothetical protein
MCFLALLILKWWDRPASRTYCPISDERATDVQWVGVKWASCGLTNLKNQGVFFIVWNRTMKCYFRHRFNKKTLHTLHQSILEPHIPFKFVQIQYLVLIWIFTEYRPTKIVRSLKEFGPYKRIKLNCTFTCEPDSSVCTVASVLDWRLEKLGSILRDN